MNSDNATLISEYQQSCALHQELVHYLEGFLRDICRQTKINIHAINGRLKSNDSFVAKIQRPEKNYKSLAEITDIAGVRVITYLNEDVDFVAKIIEREFKIHAERSSDRRAAVDPERFGYKSLHFVVELKRSRLRLPEFKRFQRCVAEIQIRSIIQHAWAEIEHDFGYKNTVSVPKTIKRRFSRLSALLELADEEFSSVAQEVNNYARQVKKQLSSSKPASGNAILVDATSLQVLITTNPIVTEIDETIANNASSALVMRGPELVAGMSARLVQAGIKDLLEVETALKKHRRLIVAWASDWLGEKKEKLSRGISIFYLVYVLLAQKGDEAFMEQNFSITNLGGTDAAARKGLIKRVTETYRALHK